MPTWIFSERDIADEFFGAFLGGEIGIPKVHISGVCLDSCAVGITCKPEYKKQTENFLNDMRKYLTQCGIQTGKISVAFNKGDPEDLILKLLLSITLENMLNLLTQTKRRYCIHKQKKLIQTLEEFAKIKRQRYRDLRAQGYHHQNILKLLNINEAVFYIIEHEKNFMHLYNAHLTEWASDTEPINYTQPTSFVST